jgi:hypothetical protein
MSHIAKTVAALRRLDKTIAALEEQRNSIAEALSLLQAFGARTKNGAASNTLSAPTKRAERPTAAGRKHLIASLQKQSAERRAAERTGASKKESPAKIAS